MYIKHDYSYISANAQKLVDNGFGKITVFSITFARYFTEEERRENSRVANSCTSDEWSKRCDEFSKSLDKPLTEIITALCKKYNIHQTTQDTSTMAHYRSNWDLYFYSNRGWNGHDYMDTMQLSFNSNRPIEYRSEILDELIPMIESMEYKNIGCRIQYEAIFDEKKISEVAGKVYNEALDDKFIHYCNKVGKIKVAKEDAETKQRVYGFFPKGARKNYYSISEMDIVLMGLQG